LSLGYIGIYGTPENSSGISNNFTPGDPYLWNISEDAFKFTTSTMLCTSLRIPLKEHLGIILGVDYYRANYSFEIIEDQPEYHSLEVKARQIRYSVGMGARF